MLARCVLAVLAAAAVQVEGDVKLFGLGDSRDAGGHRGGTHD